MRARRGSGQTGTGPRRWVLDPIDATKNYVRGVPGGPRFIGLMGRGQGGRRRGHRSRARAPLVGRGGRRRMDGAVTDQGLTVARSPRSPAVRRLVLLFRHRRLGGGGQARRVLLAEPGGLRTRGFGDFWSHMLVAEGAVDISLNPTCRCGT